MRQNLIDFTDFNIVWEVGDADTANRIQCVPALEPFSEKIVTFLNSVSKLLLSDREAKAYPDIVTLAFWMRKASVEGLKRRFADEKPGIYPVGRGVVFHIAPSNVPVNYAYSLVTGLLCGNVNVARIPSKDFPQVSIINRAIKKVLESEPDMTPYIILVKYGHDKAVNDAFSAIADVRVVWGGDDTINELRKSPMKARATEITFADRYSLAVIDSKVYRGIGDKRAVANDFYNDTFLTDQNACTSPRLVVWLGDQIQEAKSEFWDELSKLAEERYEIQGIQAVNKLTSGYLLAVAKENVKRASGKNNLIVRMEVEQLTADLMELKDNSGYFFEYDCKDIMELKNICDDTRCQTLSYIGDAQILLPLIKSGIRGLDRIVPIGRTMNFDLIWDGYNLFERLTRSITVQ